MTRNGELPSRTADGPDPSRPFDGTRVDAAGVRALREVLAGMVLPGASDTVSSVSRQVQAQWVDLLGELEAVKNTVTATQARLAVALEEATKADEARQGVRVERRGRGVANQVGAALRVSPHAGGSFLGAARVWVTQMPHTFDALRAGVLSSWRATLLVRETSHLSVEDRARIDEEICGPAHLTDLARMGTRRLVARIKDLAGRLDVQACVRRNAKAVSGRCVSVRPAPDLMVYLTALVPMAQGVQAYAQLKAHAEAVKATGDERGVGQVMADTLIERVTGRQPGTADEVPVTVNLLVSDQTLFAGGDEPGVVLEGAPAGVGTVPAPVARNLVAHGIDAGAAWLRAIYVDPKGRLLATSSTSRFFPPGLSSLLRAREQGICATAWCDAPVRHLDHITPHAEGGVTSLTNGQGLCARCNHAKQAPGWTQTVTEIDGRHAVQTVTPTGHTCVSVTPTPPAPVRSEPVKPVTVDPATAEPAAVDPAAVDPSAVDPSAVDPSAVDPSAVDPVTVDPVTVEPVTVEPVTVEPTAIQSAVQSAVQPMTVQPEPVGPVPAGSEPVDSASAQQATTPPAPSTDAIPPWTPAVGMTGPAPGRIPRSRYSIGCNTARDRGTITYRPDRPSQPNRPRHGRRPNRRTPRPARRADLTWA